MATAEPAASLPQATPSGKSELQALGATVGLVVASRGVVDLLFRRLIPWPSLFGTDTQRLREEDVMARRPSGSGASG